MSSPKEKHGKRNKESGKKKTKTDAGKGHAPTTGQGCFKGTVHCKSEDDES